MIDAELIIDRCFNIWTDGAEKLWADKVWKALIESGFAGQLTGPMGETRDYMILITLSQMYQQFCHLTFDLMEPDPITQTAYEIEEELDLVALGIIAAQADPEENWSKIQTEEDLFESTLFAAASALQSGLSSELYAVYNNNNSLLFAALYNTHKEELYLSEDLSALDDASSGNLRGFAYIDQGMPW